MIPDDPSEWPSTWRLLPLPEGWLRWGHSVEEELVAELPPRHLLSGVECYLVGWNSRHPDEFLFATHRPEFPLVMVHLTGKPESDPMWPFCRPYRDWDAFRIGWAK